MGIGDEIIASGLARGAAERGRRVAFGDGKKIIWSAESYMVLANNPNVARPGSEGAKDLEWIDHYGGHRIYGRYAQGKWHWKEFRCIPGEFYFNGAELDYADRYDVDVIIEPRVKNKPNKQWPVERYQAVADALSLRGFRVAQFAPAPVKPLLSGVRTIVPPTFRHAAAVMERSKLYVGPEGGLHHTAAAVGLGGVVIFGGFIGPETTGYAMHHNIFVGPACGSHVNCKHCADIMNGITVDRVIDAALDQLARQ